MTGRYVKRLVEQAKVVFAVAGKLVLGVVAVEDHGETWNAGLVHSDIG